MPQGLLNISNLKTYFFTSEGVAKAVDGVTFQLFPGKTLGLVGESGCGKSVTSLSIMRLIPQPPGKIVGGKIVFDGLDLLSIPYAEITKLRGQKISMVFQEPMSSLNPIFRVGDQIAEAIYCHESLTRKEAQEKALTILDKVGFPDPPRKARQYPHQLSGGLRQRVMIAMALACDPNLLIADEPTTALDVTIQAQILDLFLQIQEKEKISILFVSHDLGVIAGIAEKVAVMYAGQVVEKASVYDIFKDPLHPYTKGLLASTPHAAGMQRYGRLFTIPGVVPSPTSWPEGCRFHNRCRYVLKKCSAKEPPEFSPEVGHNVKCWLFEK